MLPQPCNLLDPCSARSAAPNGLLRLKLMLERRSVSSALNLGWRHRLSTLAALAALAALVSGRGRAAAAAGLALVALNGPFYGLLYRRGGPTAAVGGVALHTLHLLTGAAAVPAAAVSFVLEERAGSDSDSAHPPLD